MRCLPNFVAATALEMSLACRRQMLRQQHSRNAKVPALSKLKLGLLCCGIFLEHGTSQAHPIDWRKLVESVFNLVRQDGSRAQAGPGAGPVAKAIQWIVFSEGGPAGPGLRAAEALTSPLVNFYLYRPCLR